MCENFLNLRKLKVTLISIFCDFLFKFIKKMNINKQNFIFNNIYFKFKGSKLKIYLLSKTVGTFLLMLLIILL